MGKFNWDVRIGKEITFKNDKMKKYGRLCDPLNSTSCKEDFSVLWNITEFLVWLPFLVIKCACFFDFAVVFVKGIMLSLWVLEFVKSCVLF